MMSKNGDLTVSGDEFEISKVIAELTNLLNDILLKQVQESSRHCLIERWLKVERTFYNDCKISW